MWETHEEFPRTLAESWQETTEVCTLEALQRKLDRVAGHLSGWDRRRFGHVRSELNKL
jgi:hypothetical protein